MHDRLTHTTERVSRDAAGNGGDGTSALAVASEDGRLVVFESNAANLVPNGDHESHVYVLDRLTGAMERASEDGAGNAADLLSGEPDITGDGRFVSFNSLATNQRRDIFVRDRQTGTIERVSVSTAGEEGNSESVGAKISDDGLVIAFQSTADNLVPEDTSATDDIFVHDRGPAADLALAMTDAPDPVAAKGTLTYTVTATNNGPARATGSRSPTFSRWLQFLSLGRDRRRAGQGRSCEQHGNRYGQPVRSVPRGQHRHGDDDDLLIAQVIDPLPLRCRIKTPRGPGLAFARLLSPGPG